MHRAQSSVLNDDGQSTEHRTPRDATAKLERKSRAEKGNVNHAELMNDRDERDIETKLSSGNIPAYEYRRAPSLPSVSEERQPHSRDA